MWREAYVSVVPEETRGVRALEMELRAAVPPDLVLGIELMFSVRAVYSLIC